jgi:trigger factor
MKVSLNKTDNVNGMIAIEIEKPDYQEKVEKSLNQFRNKANIPGFRQGKVPKGIIQKMYGKSILADEINKLVSNELYTYIKDHNLSILGEPLPNESDETPIDFDKDENFEFKFDIALSPEFELPLNKKDKLTYYSVSVEDNLLNKQLDAYKDTFGTYQQVEQAALESDMIKGTLVEAENGDPKDEGLLVENAVLTPLYMKDAEITKQFTGTNVGDKILFNPRKAYDNNEAEIASLLQSTKDNVKDLNSDFLFEITEITRYQRAELNQELFDKVLGKDAVKSEEEFKTKVKEMLSKQYKPACDNLFLIKARELFINKLKDVVFPDEFLKRWLLASNENKTAELVDEEYPKIVEDLKYHLAKEKILKDNEIKIEFPDVEALAAEVAKAQFAQYGMTNLPAEMLENYTKSLLSKEETVRNLFDRVGEEKLIDWLKANAGVTTKHVSSEEFAKLQKKEEETLAEVK